MKICIKVWNVYLVAHFPLFAKCELIDSWAVRYSSHFSQAYFEINKEYEALGRLRCLTVLETE